MPESVENAVKKLPRANVEYWLRYYRDNLEIDKRRVEHDEHQIKYWQNILNNLDDKGE